MFIATTKKFLPIGSSHTKINVYFDQKRLRQPEKFGIMLKTLGKYFLRIQITVLEKTAGMTTAFPQRMLCRQKKL